MNVFRDEKFVPVLCSKVKAKSTEYFVKIDKTGFYSMWEEMNANELQKNMQN